MLNTQELAAEISPPLSPAQVHSQTESQKQRAAISPAPVAPAPSQFQSSQKEKGKQRAPAALEAEPSNVRPSLCLSLPPPVFLPSSSCTYVVRRLCVLPYMRRSLGAHLANHAL